ncbi:MAG: leucyl aminopeptidase [Proteobacteria bacterium]|nr:leucyl aminopeptidase [Pseudomonadota bacterium]
MEFNVKSGQLEKQRTGCLVIPVYESKHLSAQAHKINEATQGYIAQLQRRGDLTGKQGHWLLINHIDGIAAERILLLGCGKEGEIKEYQFRELMLKMMLALNETAAQDALLCITEIPVKERDHCWKIRQAIQAYHFATYRFDEFKSKAEPQRRHLQRILFHMGNRKEVTYGERAAQEGQAIVQGMEIAKNLANIPANICTPSFLADKAKKFAKQHPKLNCAILDEKQMQALNMGLLLSVTAGSQSDAKLITMEYRGAHKETKPIVLVGKGITFDTGGNSIKVPPHMIGMKYDMCGAATVFGVLSAALELALPLNIIGVIPSCENMPGPDATRPEDIVTSMSGQTVEILNTDAEGRLILADALTYCERFHPDIVIDIATLTGACSLALGPYPSGLMSNTQELADALYNAGMQSGDTVWQLPLWDEYHEALKSEFADFSNVPISSIGAGTIVAGCFLAKFTQKYQWAHLDVANTATYSSGPKRGATGRPVPLLVQYLINRCQA